jgi:hypothetical protein
MVGLNRLPKNGGQPPTKFQDLRFGIKFIFTTKIEIIVEGEE